MRLTILTLIALSLGLAAAAPRANGEDATDVCAGLDAVSIPDLRIIRSSAERLAPGPPVCRVEGVIGAEIGFELWLPPKARWNGRFLGAGVGGQAGQVNAVELRRGAARGYATASTDAGHKASDTRWLLGGPDRAINYAERANHLLAVKGKAFTAAFYGAAPDKALFIGCSGGGRQGLTELQRFPDDYDAFLIGAPGVNTPEMSARRMWEMNQHSRYAGVMSEADWAFVAKAAVVRCDAQDGLADGIVANPARCAFRVEDLACGRAAAGRCLGPEQVALARRIYAPLHDENGKQVDTGLLPGVRVQPAPVPEPFTPGPAYLATVLFGHGVHKDPNWDARRFRIADDLPAVDRVMDLHADRVDVDPFVARGGKLILYQGWADPLVPAQPTVAYFEALKARYGATASDFVRLFMGPGMEHCRGGDAPDRFGGVGGDAPIVDPDHDLLSALERWIDGGPAPERIIASKMTESRVGQTRPLCAHPREAVYRGGDPDKAESFVCAAPP